MWSRRRALGKWVVAAAVVAAGWLCAGCGPPEAAYRAIPEVVIDCRTKDPTRDKPQSKVWHGHGGWWAWLPYGKSGGVIWRRSPVGTWRPVTHLEPLTLSLPGRADVWADANGVVAALVEKRRLAVASLRWGAAEERYVQAAAPVTWNERADVETVTIDRTADGAFWVAYPAAGKAGRQIVARRLAPDLRALGEPVVLAAGLHRDDICAVTALDGNAAVMWSDQKRQAIMLRRREVGQPDADWSPAEIVARDHQTADDHINFCRPAGPGAPRLLAATKMSVDTLEEPILSLRVLTARGKWWSVPFGRLGEGRDLTRPIVLWLAGRPVALYTCRGRPIRGDGTAGPWRSIIEMQEFTREGLYPLGRPVELMRAVVGVNNVTGPKSPPRHVPCLVLASDGRGGVCEAFVEPREGVHELHEFHQ